jgi:hypothetical protein
MYVQDLINILNQHPPHTRVVVSGYEGGYNDITALKTIQMAADVHREWYMGQHDDAEKGGEQALLLFGENNLAEE